MSNILYLFSEVLVVIVPVLLAVAFMTIIERKQLAAMQRRVGPNQVGYYGVLQPSKKNTRWQIFNLKNKTIC
jgi:NADH-ubiquinone oxidoreductase chain 1